LETFIVDSLEDPMVVVFVSYLSLCSLVCVRYFSFKERVETVLFMGKQDSKPKREKRDKKKYARARGNIPHL
jgi:hypothetical protein